jgi:hypothetical protein
MFGAMPSTAETPRSLEERLDQEQAPSIADAFQRRGQGCLRSHRGIVGHRS